MGLLYEFTVSTPRTDGTWCCLDCGTNLIDMVESPIGETRGLCWRTDTIERMAWFAFAADD